MIENLKGSICADGVEVQGEDCDGDSPLGQRCEASGKSLIKTPITAIKVVRTSNDGLGIEVVGGTMSPAGDSSTASDEGYSLIREIDKCLDHIRDLASPIQYHLHRPCPFKRPGAALDYYSDPEDEDPEITDSSLELTDNSSNEWSLSLEESSAATSNNSKMEEIIAGCTGATSAENLFPQPIDHKLGFTGIHVIYDEPATPGVDWGLVTAPVVEQMPPELESDEEMIWEDVAVDGQLLHAIITKGGLYYVSQGLSSKTESVVDADGIQASDPIREPLGSEFSATENSEDPVDARELSDDSSLEVADVVESDDSNFVSKIPRYVDAITQTEDPISEDDEQPESAPDPTHIDCQGLYNVKLPKVGLSNCLLYGAVAVYIGYRAVRAGGVALYVGHQAFRAFHRRSGVELEMRHQHPG